MNEREAYKKGVEDCLAILAADKLDKINLDSLTRTQRSRHINNDSAANASMIYSSQIGLLCVLESELRSLIVGEKPPKATPELNALVYAIDRPSRYTDADFWELIDSYEETGDHNHGTGKIQRNRTNKGVKFCTHADCAVSRTRELITNRKAHPCPHPDHAPDCKGCEKVSAVSADMRAVEALRALGNSFDPDADPTVDCSGCGRGTGPLCDGCLNT